MHGIKARTLLFWGMVLMLSDLPCGAAQLPVKLSGDFDWKYEMDVLPSAQDLDGNGSPDFLLSGSAITSDGAVLTIPEDHYVESSGLGIWQNRFSYTDGYTIEARVKILQQTQGEGAWALYSAASDADTAGVLKVGAQDQGWGATGSNLGENDNTDDFHVFRVAQHPGTNCYTVWRDDVLLATGLANAHTVPNALWFGDGTGSWQGSARVDYFRFTEGAFAPNDCPLPSPIASVEKTLYMEGAPEGSAYVGMHSVGPGLERLETRGIAEADDILRQREFRISTDNGRTWSAPESMPNHDVYYQGTAFWEGEGAMQYDPASGLLVGTWLRQVAQGGVYHNFTYFRVSDDLGQTWSEPKQLHYEPGALFDPANPLDPNFLNHNEAYFGNNLLLRSDGKLMHAVGHANDPNDPQNDTRPWRMGSVVFVGQWDPAAEDYVWTPSERITIAPEMSARGLMEPEVAELQDGRIAVVWRGSTHGWDGTVAELPGRKFYSISNDGGQTFSDPAVWQYDDGADFYSPSSYHRMVRHGVTGKLYWIGNISSTPPVGNQPRYPLVIAEVDEENFSLRHDTVTTIDTRQPGEPAIALSNFALLENRETHDLEIYMTREGDPSGNDVYQYLLTLHEVADLLLADLDGDGFVGGDDLDLVRAHWGENVPCGDLSSGDPSGDGFVGGDDLDLVRAHWGAGTPPARAIPEPSAAVLFLAGWLVWLGATVVNRHRTGMSREHHGIGTEGGLPGMMLVAPLAGPVTLGRAKHIILGPIGRFMHLAQKHPIRLKGPMLAERAETAVARRQHREESQFFQKRMIPKTVAIGGP